MNLIKLEGKLLDNIKINIIKSVFVLLLFRNATK